MSIIQFDSNDPNQFFEQMSVDELTRSLSSGIANIPLLKFQTDALEKAGLAFYITNKSSDRFEYLSPNFKKFFGLTEAKSRNLCATEFNRKMIHPVDYAEMRELAKKTFENVAPNESKSVHYTSRYSVTGKGNVWVETWETVLFDKDSQPALAVSCMQDVSESYRAKEERDRALGCIAHDLRNPITVIRGYLSIIEKQATESLSKEHLMMIDRAIKACARMTEMTDSFLTIEKINSLVMNEELEPVDIHEFLESRISDFEQLFAKKEIIFTSECNKEIGSCAISQKLVELLIENLLTNASKFSFRGSEVNMSVYENEQNEIEFKVEDHGVGMSEDDCENLFQEYAHLSSNPTGGETSTGIGLTICKRIAMYHKGRLWCESEVGEGTCFYFSFPKIEKSKK